MLFDDEITHASRLLHDDQLVAFPTETVYGIGGNAYSDKAVAAIYAAKERPEFNPLIVHVASTEEALKHAVFNETAKKLARTFWPGPLTLVLPRRKDCTLSLLVSAGMDTVALRIPNHPLAQSLLHAAQLPIAAPSANRSGRISPTDAQHVREEMEGRVELVLDGGPCSIGLESTVVDATGDVPVILRPGSIGADELGAQTAAQPTPDSPLLSPGMLESHYAPTSPVRLNATSLQPGEALLAFGSAVPQGAAYVENLSANGNLKEAAANLFRMLRKLDSAKPACIAIMPIPPGGEHAALGIAINDRLQRAAAPRR